MGSLIERFHYSSGFYSRLSDTYKKNHSNNQKMFLKKLMENLEKDVLLECRPNWSKIGINFFIIENMKPFARSTQKHKHCHR